MILKFSHTIFGIFIVFIISGIFSPLEFNFINVKLVLELVLACTFILSLKSVKKQLLGYCIITFLYILYSYIHAFDYKIIDFIMIYKTLFYLLILSFLINRELFNYTFIKYFFYTVAISFLVKYLYSIMFGFTLRPGLFTENNFEIMFLLLLFIAKRHFEHRYILQDYFLLLIIILLSGSRSAILCMLPLAWFDKFGNKFHSKLIKLPVLIFAFILGFSVIYFRMGGLTIEQIDRIRFLFVFLDEIHEWSVWQYLFGNTPITPLSTENCESLIYYSSLFSNVSNNLCFSVVFHSHLLRTIIDHGILGLIFIYMYTYKILVLSLFNRDYIFMILSILFINGLSVSSLNSVFAAFGLMILITLDSGQEINDSKRLYI